MSSRPPVCGGRWSNLEAGPSVQIGMGSDIVSNPIH